MANLLTIAGTDPSGGAGLQVDLQVFRDFGFHGLSVVTAVVWQNTVGIRGFEPVDSVHVADQIDAVVDDSPPEAIKIGMVPTAETAEGLAGLLTRWPEGKRPPVVFDPVMAGGGGSGRLLRPGTKEALSEVLVAEVDWVTPNVPEAEALTGRTIESHQGMYGAAEQIAGAAGVSVVLKGGHLRSGSDESVVDVWAGGGEAEMLEPFEAIAEDVRGTGCQLSSALAALLASGFTGVEAVRRARRYLNKLLHESTAEVGRGRSVVVRGDGRSRRAARQVLDDPGGRCS